MIRFHDVSKTYPGRENALSNVTVEIPNGDFVFLIGPSGAGKTTFLRLIIREILPTQGKVYVDDWDLTKLPRGKVHQLRRKVGMVFQDFKILTDRTVFENVALGLEILGKKANELEKDVHDVLGLVGLSSKYKHFPQQLSVGELQRTSIARAVVGGPNFLLADEPTGNLDPRTAWEILDVLQEINKIGTTVIMATHNADIVNHLKRRTIMLEAGSLTSDEAKGKYQVVRRDQKHHSNKDGQEKP